MAQSKKITLRDVAKALGVSASTVSFALNNKGRLPEERRAEIRDLAAKMGYTPNPMARALRGADTGCIGLVINYFNNPYYRSFIAGLESSANDHGFSFAVTQHRDIIERERKQVKLLAERGMDGLIVVPCTGETDHLTDIIQTYGIPLVLTSHTLPGFAGVEADNVRGTRMMTEHILSLKRPNNILLAAQMQKSAITTRKEVFCKIMAAHDPNFDAEENVFYTKTLTADGGFRVMGAIAAKFKPPYSVFSVSDEIALGAMRFCRHNRLRIPEDVAIAGYSDIDILEDYGIPLTTVRIPARSIGENVVELLLEMKRNKRIFDCPPIITLPVSLVTRSSTVGYSLDEPLDWGETRV